MTEMPPNLKALELEQNFEPDIVEYFSFNLSLDRQLNCIIDKRKQSQCHQLTKHMTRDNWNREI